MLQHSTDAIIGIDAARNIVRWNAAAERLFGYPPQDVIGGPIDRLMPAGTRDDARRELEAMIAGEALSYETRRQRADGSIFPVAVTLVPERDGSGNFLGATKFLRDITARKAQDEALRKSQGFLDRTGRLAGVGGWEFDIATSTVLWSEQTCRILGVPPGHRPTLEEAFGFYPPEAQQSMQAAVNRALATGEAWDMELPCVRADGREIWVRAVGHVECEGAAPVRLVGALQDITELAHERLALKKSNARIALATQSGGIGVWERDFVTGERRWDDCMCRLVGLPPGKPIHAEDFALRVHPRDLAAVEAAMEASRKDGQRFETEYRVFWDDGSVHHVRSVAQAVVDAGGAVVGLIGVAWETTHIRRMAAELAQQHELLRVTLESIGDAVITTDARGHVQWLNPIAERMTGWTSPEARNRLASLVVNIVQEQSGPSTYDPVANCLAQGRAAGRAGQGVLISRGGVQYGIEDSVAPIRNASGDVLGAVLVLHDVSEQRRMSGEMNYRATHDLLTGLVNRAEFESRLARSLESACEHQTENALLYLDLDQFKLVNDACGHSVGDELLQQVSKLLLSAIRSRDTLARLGGDEFGIILEHCTAVQAHAVAQKICDLMEDFRFVHDDRRFRVGTSIGLVPIDSRWSSMSAILQAADSCCYAAKEAGRNRVQAWLDTDETMHARQGEMQWVERIERALDEDRFVLYAQRVVEIQKAAGGLRAEVLLRLRQPDGTIIAPGAFLPAAERFHLASRVDRWVLQRAIRWMQDVPCLEALECLSVNLSGQSIGDRAFHRWATQTLGSCAPQIRDRLCIEVTETAAITNLADAALFIEQVRASGVRVALDDFGAGASSFGYLKSLAVDILKIDGQFVRDVVNDALDQAAVRCFVEVAKVVGVKTVAEFVDHPAVLERLKTLGVDYAQGYLLHRPAPLDDLRQLLLEDGAAIAVS